MAKLAPATLVIIAALALPVGAQTGSHQHSGPTHRQEASQSSSAFAQTMAGAMERMHHDMMTAAQTGDPDRDFLVMMIPHHAGAVEMARLVLIHGRDPLVRQLAEEIIAGQQAEISTMRARLDVLQRGPDPLPGGFPAVGGTRGE